MLYRIAALGIALFWLVMMGMLIKLETQPDSTDILDVPVSYVERIIFKHGQQSILTVRDGDMPVGNFSMRPSITGTNGRALDFSGSFSFLLPLATGRQRLSFNGKLNMDAALATREFHLDLNMAQSHSGLTLAGDTTTHKLTYAVTQAGRRVSGQTLAMDPATLGPALLSNLGIETPALTAALTLLPIGAGPPPDVSARETEITLHGEKLQVYEVSVREGSVDVADLYVTELGQIVLAKTGFGYTLGTEDVQ